MDIKGLVNEEGKFSNNPLGVLNWLKRTNRSDYQQFC